MDAHEMLHSSCSSALTAAAAAPSIGSSLSAKSEEEMELSSILYYQLRPATHRSPEASKNLEVCCTIMQVEMEGDRSKAPADQIHVDL
jgi:hypothetical protein